MAKCRGRPLEGIEAQTHLVIDNLARVLAGVGLGLRDGLRDALRVSAYLNVLREVRHRRGCRQCRP